MIFLGKNNDYIFEFVEVMPKVYCRSPFSWTRCSIFRAKRCGNIATGTPLRGCQMQGYEIVAIFEQYLALSRKRYNIEPVVTTELNANRKSYAIYRMVLFSMTSSDLAR